MAYIGLPPKANFTSGLLDRFTSTTGTTVTLTHDIASENDIVVFVNFVKQDSTTYSVGGTGNKTLTLGGTLVSSDIVEVHYLNIVGQTVNPSANSVGSSQITADVITGQTALAVAPASTDELLISDAGTLKRIDVSLIGGQNTPAVSAYSNSNQTVSDNTLTKVEFDAEEYDTDSAFDKDTNYRFTVPSGKAGKYFIHASIYLYGNNNDEKLKGFDIYKNGASVRRTENFSQFSTGNGSGGNSTNTAVLDLAESDYIEIYAKVDVNSGTANIYGASGTASRYTVLHIFKLVE